MLFRSPRGYNYLRLCLADVNKRLPEFLQLENPTGHCGRKSMVTLAVNANVSAEVVSLASHHKDPKTLMGYIAPSPLNMMTAGLAIGGAAIDSRRRSRHVAGLDLDCDEENVDSSNVQVECPIVQSEVSSSFSSIASGPVKVSSEVSCSSSGSVYHFHFV